MRRAVQCVSSRYDQDGPGGSGREEFGSEQRVLHLGTVSKIAAVQSLRCNALQHAATRQQVSARPGASRACRAGAGCFDRFVNRSRGRPGSIAVLVSLLQSSLLRNFGSAHFTAGVDKAQKFAATLRYSSRHSPMVRSDLRPSGEGAYLVRRVRPSRAPQVIALAVSLVMVTGKKIDPVYQLSPLGYTGEHRFSHKMPLLWLFGARQSISEGS